MTGTPRRIAHALSLVLLAAGPIAAAPRPAAPPPVPLGPPQIHLAPPPDGIPLDMRLAGDPGYVAKHPAPVCGTTRDLALAAPHVAEREALRHAAHRSSTRTGVLGPNVFIQDGIVVMENDGRLIVDDRHPDLEGKTAQLVPSGGGFAATLGASTWYPPSVAPLFQDERGGFRAYALTLPFSFPFGNQTYTQVWMTNTGAIYFAAPSAPASTQVNEAITLYDRSPRISALLGGTSYYTWTGYFETVTTFPNSYAVFTWATGDVELQVTILQNGNVSITWNKLGGLHGTASCITGNDAFWSTETEVASWSDPAGDANGHPAPDGLALDVTGVHMRAVPGTGVTRIVLDLAGPIPTTGGNLLYYELTFFPDPASSTQVGYEYAQFRDGVQTGGGAWARINGSTLELGVPSWRFGVSATSFDLRISTWWNNGGWAYGDWIPSPGVTIPQVGPRLMTDWSADLPLTTTAPLYECFTLGSLDTYAVYAAYQQTFGTGVIESLPIFQNIYTDIIFYAGAYSTVGNAAAAGIGVGNKNDPPYPALLHMNTIGYGWNANEPGRTTVLNQEFGHHWSYFARFKENGVTSTVLNPDGAHPAGWVHTAAMQDVLITPDFSSFGGSFWTDHLDGSFTSSVNAWAGTGLWPVELYTMGLMGASEVPDWWYLKDPDQPIANAYWAATNQTVRATRVPVTIQQIIDNEGPRDPAYPMAPRDFVTPFVLVVRPGTLVAAESQEVAKYCSEWEKNFRTSSWNRGSISCFSSCVQPPGAVSSSLKLVKAASAGEIHFHWQNLSPSVTDYPIYQGNAKDASFVSVLGAGSDGATGVALLPAIGSPLYYRVAGRNGPGCVGPR